MFGSRAVDTINDYAKAAQPFLISLHFNAPHWPWEAPGDEAESNRLRGKDLADFDGGTQKIYRRMIAAMDLQIGRVLEALAANDIAGNTIVIFTSDNGGERFADTWPFTERKTQLLEGGLRIPALVSWPGHIPRGRTTDQVAISMDWVPTLLASAGTAPDPASRRTARPLPQPDAECHGAHRASCSGATRRTGSGRCAMANLKY